MSGNSNGNQQSGRSGRRRRGNRQPSNVWRAAPPPPDAQPIAPATDPAMVLRSLGDPPLPGQGAVAEHYLAAVIERASQMATALAAAAGVLASPDSGDVDDGDAEAV
jgi:hypothetical protein